MDDNEVPNKWQKGLDKSQFGWSISKIFLITSIVFLLCAGLLQYLIIDKVVNKFQQTIETEMVAKVVGQIDNLKPRLLANIQPQYRGLLSSLANDFLRTDNSFNVIVFYDAKGQLISYFQNAAVSQIMVSKLTKVAKLQNLNNAATRKGAEVSFFNVLNTRIIDIATPLDGRLSNSPNVRRYGFVRLLLTVDSVGYKLQDLRLAFIALVFLTTIGCAVAFWFVIRKTITNPIERSVAVMEYVVENVERIPALELRTTDAWQIKKLISALHAGLSEISIRHRSVKLLDATRKSLEMCKDEDLLGSLRDVWVESKLAASCQIVLARFNSETKHYLVEELTPSYDADMSLNSLGRRMHRLRQTQHLDLKKDLMIESVRKFLGKDLEIDWNERWLLAKAPFHIMSEEHVIVAALIPNASSGLSPARFEELSLIWLREVTRLYQEVRYKNFAGEIELAREVQRKWVQTDGQADVVATNDLEDLFACDSLLGSQAMSDFLFATKMPASMASITVIGTVSAQGIRGALASTSLVAALSDRFQLIRQYEPNRLLKSLLASINSYLWSVYNGQVSANCLAIYFDHDKGLGFFASYGSKYPFLLTPHERKPLVIAQGETCSALGSMENFNFVTTSFPVYSGQIIFAGTSGYLEIDSGQGQRFEKAIMSGALSELVDIHYLEPAKILLQHFFESGRSHAGTRVIGVDFTGVVLKRRNIEKNM